MAHELSTHVKKSADEPLVGLALSGGGLRSAAFGLGVLQTLARLGFLDRVDYFSTVSGGGYIGGWLHATLARGGRASLHSTHQGQPAPAGSDPWGLLGRQFAGALVNFTILSLFLLAPLFVPWITAGLFWQAVVEVDHLWLLAAAVLLLTIALVATTVSLENPLHDGWSPSSVASLGPMAVYLVVVTPSLLGGWLVGTVALAWSRDGRFDHTEGWLSFALGGGVAYGGIWLAGMFAAVLYSKKWNLARSATAFVRTVWLVTTAMVSAAAATLIVVFVCDRLASESVGPLYVWLTGLLSLPTGAIGLSVAEVFHIALAGRVMTEEMREWAFRVLSIRLAVAAAFVGLAVVSLLGPHVLGSSWLDPAQDSPVKAAATAVLAFLAFLARDSWGRLNQGALAGKSWQVRLLVRVGLIVAVVVYALMLSSFVHSAMPIVTMTVAGGVEVLSLCSVEASLRQLPVAAGLSLVDPACPPVGAALVPGAELLGLVAMALGTLVAAWLISGRVDLNDFSFPSVRRSWLIRCFLGPTNRRRRAHPFTGVDPGDDMPLSKAVLGESIRPYPIFNCAMSTFTGQGFLWRQRRFASFVLTPEYSGYEFPLSAPGEGQAYRSGYAPTAAHAGAESTLTVGDAMAISGVERNGALAFVQDLFNVTSGWRSRNPGLPVWAEAKARASLRETLYDLLGLATDQKDWVYLTDGGRFDNLGLYELVRRRCQFIIVADATDDPLPTFAGLAQAINRCRSDFGVSVEINLDQLRPSSSASGVKSSRRQCAVGRIRYDFVDPAAQAGTLLYLKASLTGSEPMDVQQYATSHAEFPNTGTDASLMGADAFEAYRVLGNHCARTAFGVVCDGEQLKSLDDSEIVTRLRWGWQPPLQVSRDASIRHYQELNRLWTTVRTTQELRFLADQMFPEMPTLMMRPGDSHNRIPPNATNYWLPSSEYERSAGFFVCFEILQFMEAVFVDLRLEEFYDHIECSGWMNLFGRWAWTGMLNATFAVVGSTQRARFRKFCLERLDLSPGSPRVAAPETWLDLPSPDHWRASDPEERAESRAVWQEQVGLSEWETELVAKYLVASQRPGKLGKVCVVVESPRRSDGNPFQFNVGYVIGDLQSHEGSAYLSLHYMRIQHHMRKMGLARAALVQLLRWSGANLVVAEPMFDSSVVDGGPSDEGLPLPNSVARLRGIVRSLPRATILPPRSLRV